LSIVIHLANLISAIAPVRELCGLRRGLLRLGGIRIGNATRITHGVAFYDKHVTIGEGVWIGMNTKFYSTGRAHIIVGNNIDIAPDCSIISGTHHIGGAARRAGPGRGEDVVIGDGTWVGAGCRILPGAEIGPGCVVAAGAVVLRGKYEANSLLAGVPAKALRNLDHETRCSGKAY